MAGVERLMKPNVGVRICCLLSLLLLLNSVLKGIRYPNNWSYTHFLFNYDYGFVKRGLLGEIVGLFDGSYLSSYEFFVGFSTAILAANVVLLAVLARDLVKSRNVLIIGPTLIFCSSLAVVFLSHAIGYFDQIDLLIVLVALRLSGFYRKALFLMLATPVAVLIHEATVVMFFPVAFMSLLLDVNGPQRMKQLLLLLIFSGMTITLMLVCSSSNLDRSESRRMYIEMQSDTDHLLRRHAFYVLHQDVGENYLMMRKYWSDESHVMRLRASFLATAPVSILLICGTVLVLVAAKARMYQILLAVLASTSPCLLHLFGFDMHRWNTLAITTSFLMFYVAYRFISKIEIRKGSKYLITILLL